MPKSRSDSSCTQVTPNPELEKRTRRRFPAEYKLRIISEADACKHGELGGILRRENNRRVSTRVSRLIAYAGVAVTG